MSALVLGNHKGLPLHAGAGSIGRVLRGGSFINNGRNARCAYRDRNDNPNRNNGFRVAASTFFFGSMPELPGGSPSFRAEAKNGGACSWPRCGNADSRANSNGPAP